jgi:hypothetical protein
MKQVIEWVSKQPWIRKEHVDIITKERIDGVALLNLTREDLRSLGFPWGPAFNLAAEILKFRKLRDLSK